MQRVLALRLRCSSSSILPLHRTCISNFKPPSRLLQRQYSTPLKDMAATTSGGGDASLLKMSSKLSKRPSRKKKKSPKTSDPKSGRESSSVNAENPRASSGSTIDREDTGSRSAHSQKSPWSSKKPDVGKPSKGVNTKKRKAETTMETKQRQRQRVSRQPLENDREHILKTMNLPTPGEFPGLPKNFMDVPKSVVNNHIHRPMIVKFGLRSLGEYHWRCTVKCHVPDLEIIEVFGDGSNKSAADNAASLHLLAKLHEHGLLKEIFGSAILNQRVMKEEKAAKVDIYEYAAKYGCVPIFTETRHSRLSSSKRKPTYEVGIELPEQDIKVSGMSTSLPMAETVACLHFKKAAERYHLAKGTESVFIKDSASLGSGNSQSFREFYYMQCPHDRFSLKVTPLARQRFESQAMLNSQNLGPAIQMATKKQAEEVGMLVAAVELTKEKPELLAKFFRALRKGGGKILGMPIPIRAEVDSETLNMMRDAVINSPYAGSSVAPDTPKSSAPRVREPSPYVTIDSARIERLSATMQKEYKRYLQDPKMASMRQIRAELPMNQYTTQVLEMVEKHVFCIVVGATGSGKTTQVPQILLEDATQKGTGGSCSILCTQPRRIAATSVARRVAQERGELLQDAVGFKVRFESKPPRVGGSITYCTTGILLIKLQQEPDSVLESTSHLVIDEVHERDMILDFLLILLKRTMAERLSQGKSVPKVILMSATMDSELFSSYFQTTHPTLGTLECPTLMVPGRTFPVKERYLEGVLGTLKSRYSANELSFMYQDEQTKDHLEVEEGFAKSNPAAGPSKMLEDDGALEQESIIDWKKERMISADGEEMIVTRGEEALVPTGLVAATVSHIVKTTQNGAILVFLPGLQDLVRVQEILTGKENGAFRGNVSTIVRPGTCLGVDFNDETKFKLFLLHSSIPDSQTKVFDPVPEGCRKIILSTNIAETSVTIPEVQYVVDTGKIRESRYDQLNRISSLQCTWVSKSNAKQRAGRAGRVQNGHYYGLYSKARFDSLRAIGLPELLRSDLQETCLDIKKTQLIDYPIRDFLSQAMEAPSPTAIDAAVDNLVKLGALNEEEELTPLGRLLGRLPVHPSLGKMIVLGIIFRCLDPMLLLGASVAARGLFVNPLNAREEAEKSKKQFSLESNSDHIAFLNAFRELRYHRRLQGDKGLFSFARQSFLHEGAFRSIDKIARHIENVLVDAGIAPITHNTERLDDMYGPPSLNQNSHSLSLIKALIVAGFNPNIAVSPHGRMLYRTQNEKNTLLVSNSVVLPSRNRSREIEGFPQLLSFSTLYKAAEGGTMFLRDVTEITPLMAMLFGGDLYTPLYNKRIEINEWLPIWVNSDNPRGVQIISAYRKALDRMLEAAYKNLSSREPLVDNPDMNGFVKRLVEVMRLEDEAPLSIGAGQVESWSSVMNTWEKQNERRERKADGFTWEDRRTKEKLYGDWQRKGSRTQAAGYLFGSKSGFEEAKNTKRIWGY